jgi:hypothetical protein
MGNYWQEAGPDKPAHLPIQILKIYQLTAIYDE